jgi:5-methylcytosine-specific restriction protein A
LVRDGGGYCIQHKQVKQEIRKQADRDRGTSTQRGYGYKWQQLRARYLASHPLCVECKRAGLVKIAEVVDHIVPHKGDMALFWDSDNWQPLCKACHDRKTATEDGGWGRG